MLSCGKVIIVNFTLLSYIDNTGLEINPVAHKVRKLKRNFAKFRRKIVALHCVVSGVAKYEPTILVLKETAENGE